MTINVQCVYGNDNVNHINNCIIPNLKSTCHESINFLCMNYERDGVLIESGERFGVKVINIKKEKHESTGFSENHNYIFNNSEQTENFVLMNPDCIPLPNSIDMLLLRKSNNKSIAIVEGRQWPFEHPKEYDKVSLETPWSSGAFELIDSNFYKKINGMDELYFLYNEDVDLSWQAWINGYKVLYEPAAQIIHFTNGFFERHDIISNERYYSLRNFILISKKFFGNEGEKKAINQLQNTVSKSLFETIINDYSNNIRDKISDRYIGKRHRHVKILGINLFAKHTGEWA